MIPIEKLRRRFIKDSSAIQLGGIASDLLRLANLAKSNEVYGPVFNDVLTETKLFTEWAAPKIDFSKKKKILLLQRALSNVVSEGVKTNPSAVEKKMKRWSRQTLKMSGLIK